MLAVEGENGVATEAGHVAQQTQYYFGGEQVAVEQFSAGRAGDSAVGTDEGDIEAERVGDGQSEVVATASD